MTNDSDSRGRVPTLEEAEAILTLVRGGWLKLNLTLDSPALAPEEDFSEFYIDEDAR